MPSPKRLRNPEARTRHHSTLSRDGRAIGVGTFTHGRRAGSLLRCRRASTQAWKPAALGTGQRASTQPPSSPDQLPRTRTGARRNTPADANRATSDADGSRRFRQNSTGARSGTPHVPGVPRRCLVGRPGVDHRPDAGRTSIRGCAGYPRNCWSTARGYARRNIPQRASLAGR